MKAYYDVTAAIIDYENGDLNEEKTIELFQHLVDTGLAWQLQGAYGRMAARLIDAGLVKPAGRRGWAQLPAPGISPGHRTKRSRVWIEKHTAANYHFFQSGGRPPMNKRKTVSTLRRMLTLVTEDACPGAGEAVKDALRAVHAYPEPQKAALGGLTTAKKYSKAQRAKWGKLGGRPRKRRARKS